MADMTYEQLLALMKEKGIISKPSKGVRTAKKTERKTTDWGKVLWSQETVDADGNKDVQGYTLACHAEYVLSDTEGYKSRYKVIKEMVRAGWKNKDADAAIKDCKKKRNPNTELVDAAYSTLRTQATNACRRQKIELSPKEGRSIWPLRASNKPKVVTFKPTEAWAEKLVHAYNTALYEAVSAGSDNASKDARKTLQKHSLDENFSDDWGATLKDIDANIKVAKQLFGGRYGKKQDDGVYFWRSNSSHLNELIPTRTKNVMGGRTKSRGPARARRVA